MEAIILAGGLGSRLSLRLNGIPKPMAPISGRPFLEILLGQLGRSGCNRVLLSVGHLHQVIQDHFGSWFQGMRLEYVIEKVPLGTGGAIRAALPRVIESAILVLNGDTFLEVDHGALLRFHTEQEVPITLTVAHQLDITRYGSVHIEKQRIVSFEEKGRSGSGWINAGVYVLRSDLTWPAALADSFSFERDFIIPEIGRLPLAAFEVRGSFLDIGVPEDLARAEKELKFF